MKEFESFLMSEFDLENFKKGEKKYSKLFKIFKNLKKNFF